MALDQWQRKPVPLCPRAQSKPDPCDCGYVGDWLVRSWKALQPCSPTFGYRQADGTKMLERRCADCKRGGEGHLTYAGWEECCPRCGDVERFTFDGELVGQFRNPAYTGSRNLALSSDQLSLLDDG